MRIRRFIKLFFLIYSCLVLFAVPALAETIHLFAGAGLRQPIDRLIASFEAKTGHKVQADYGGSGKQCVKIRTAGQGDLFMPGAFFYIEDLQKDKLAHDPVPVAVHTPVVGVNKSCAIAVNTLDDLATPGLRIALGDPKAMALGRTAMDILERSGKKDAILKNVVVYGATVKQLALYLKQGDVDAAIIGRADAFQCADRIRSVPIPDKLFRQEIIAVAMLTNGLNRPEVKQLKDHLSGEEAVRAFGDFGFLACKK